MRVGSPPVRRDCSRAPYLTNNAESAKANHAALQKNARAAVSCRSRGNSVSPELRGLSVRRKCDWQNPR
jgi:hypothetical protein